MDIIKQIMSGNQDKIEQIRKESKQKFNKLEQNIPFSAIPLVDTPPSSKGKELSEETKRIIEQVKKEMPPSKA